MIHDVTGDQIRRAGGKRLVHSMYCFTGLSGKIITGLITESLTLAIQTKWLNFRFCKVSAL
ncbi:hypothetical protein A4H97_24780 [Niastella yeongjuensis]|uniref:Uncharacterized protein n=1 Tax=Niastella yeongjuensis TaxID=354355 RepID=A0A1V9F2M7_9BACT|nr:hypothetical protein A4H97_24780 [Niastella yeongjuensis]